MPTLIPHAMLGEARLDREAVEAHTVRFFRRGWSALPDVRLVEWQGKRWTVKDWSQRSWLRRTLQGHFMLRREHRFLQALAGIDGVPQVLGFPDEDCLAIEFIDGQCTSAVLPQDYPPGFFARLEALLVAIQARGLTHGDLDQDDNMLLRADGSPAIIDFGNSVMKSRWPVLRQVYELLAAHDRHCVWRLRERFDLERLPEHLPPPPLALWQYRLLRLLNKVERKEAVRVHGVGEAQAGG